MPVNVDLPLGPRSTRTYTLFELLMNLTKCIACTGFDGNSLAAKRKLQAQYPNCECYSESSVSSVVQGGWIL